MTTLRIFLLFVGGLVHTLANAQAPDLGGVKVSFDGYQGPATLAAERIEQFKVRISIEPKGETRPLALRIELPKTGRDTWPAEDVEVRAADGAVLLVQRSGIEWEKLRIAMPAGVTTCFIQAVEPPVGRAKTTSERDRSIQDTVSGVKVRIANWPDGRTAALSIRFDDSHPTHLSKAIPILREYGFRGTFMVNPGPKEPGSRQNYAFETQHAEWEAVMEQGDQELANHSAHHRGAKGDDEMEAEIGTAAQAIWKLTSGKSKLIALNLGGGTIWETTRTLRHYLDKHHQFDASSGSLGMDDSYGGRVAAFRQMLEQHITRGLWCRVHYHYIGEGLSTSEANFRAALDIAKQHQDKLWIAGMADIHKYQTERNAAKLTLLKSGAQHLTFQLTCPTDATLYDQPLTIEVLPPDGWDRQKVTIRNSQGTSISTANPSKVEGIAALRVEVPPRDAIYSISLTP